MQTELAIIGAGPAGLAAAETASRHGVSVTIIDEQARSGGQIYRQPPECFTVEKWLSGRIYRPLRRLVSAVEGLKEIQWLFQTSVLGITESHESAKGYKYQLLLNSEARGCLRLDARCVLIASGCYDMPALFPGWNLPGVMATGGIQAFIKSQQLVPGERFVFAGSHPLQLIVADQVARAGGTVEAVLFCQPLRKFLTPLRHPLVLLRHAGQLAFFLAVLSRLVMKGIPVRFSQTVLAAQGGDSLQALTVGGIDASGRLTGDDQQTLRCDRLGVCFSFLASSELARQAGASCNWSADSGGWLIEHDQWQQTNCTGLYVAGEITGVAGASVALEEGRLAGLGVALAQGRINLSEAESLARLMRRRLASLNRFARLLRDLSYPGRAIFEQLGTEDSTLCKCEEITVGEFRDCLRDYPHPGSANAAKLLSRAGMGMCQGRFCGYHISCIMADVLGKDEKDIGPLTARFPAKPILIESLLSPVPKG